MDPFSLIVGVAGLISLGIELEKIISSYSESVRSADKRTQELGKVLALLITNLRQLETFLRGDGRSIAFDHTSVIFATLHGLKTTLTDACNRLRPSISFEQRYQRILHDLKYPFSEKEHQNLVNYLHNLVSSIEFSLTIDGCRLLSQTSSVVSEMLLLERQTLEEVITLSQKLSTTSIAVGDVYRSLSGVQSTLKTIELAQYQAQSSTKDIISNLNLIEDTVHVANDARVKAEIEKGRLDLLNWVSQSKPEEKQNIIFKTRTQGTCEWILEDPNFQAWNNAATGSLLWFHGLPGSGKTRLCSFVIEALQSSLKVANQSLCLAYCDYKDDDARQTSSIVSSLLRQCIEQLESIPDQEQELLLARMKDRKPLSKGDASVIVIDGLDEVPRFAETGNELRSTLVKSIQVIAQTHLILVTSRVEHLAQSLHGAKKVAIVAKDEDVMKYTERRMRENAGFRQMIQRDHGLEADILREVPTKAAGMFLRAQLLMDTLISEPTARRVRSSLTKTSSSIAHLYDTAFERVRGQRLSCSMLALKSIYWVFQAKRRLHIDELRHALSLEEDDVELLEDGMSDSDLLMELCAGLLVIEPETMTVRLVHLTLQEFMSEEPQPAIESLSHGLGIACLQYMTFEVFKSGACEQADQLRQRRRKYAFLEYASTYWGEHVPSPLPATFRALLKRFFQNQLLIDCASQASGRTHQSQGEGEGTDFIRGVKPLHLAAYFGLVDIVHMILEQDETCSTSVLMEDEDRDGYTALQWAIVGGRAVVCRLLVELGAKVERPEDSGDVPIMLATETGAADILLILLEHLRQKETLDCNLEVMGSALYECGWRGLTDCARALLDYGANIEAGADDGVDEETPLYMACKFREETTAHVLLARGANANTQCFRGKTALNLATDRCSLRLVQALLDAGADPNIAQYRLSDMRSGGKHNTEAGPRDALSPLLAAIRRYDFEMVRLLLSWGADPNLASVMPSITMALDPTWINRPEAMVKAMALLLLEAGASVSATASDLDQANALHLASEAGFQEVAEVLLAAGASIYSRDALRRIPLHYACRGGSLRMTLWLLAIAQAEWIENQIETPDGKGLRPLHFAALGKHSEISIPLLIERGAQVDSLDQDANTTLHYAAHFGHKIAVKYLLENGADVNTRGFSQLTPLHVAADKGHMEIARLLLDAGAKDTFRDADGTLAIHRAAAFGHSDVVTLLLRSGSDREARSASGRTALHYACHRQISMETESPNSPHMRFRERIMHILYSENTAGTSDDAVGALQVKKPSDAKHSETIDVLLAAGADILALDDEQVSPFWLAVRRNHVAAAERLLQVMPDVIKSDPRLRDLLSGAVLIESESMVQLLLTHIADKSCTDTVGLNALHHAAEKGNLKIIGMLLEVGIDIDMASPDTGATPLCLAANQSEGSATVRLLLAHGANPDAPGSDLSPLHYAVQESNEDAILALLEAGADLDRMSHVARVSALFSAVLFSNQNIVSTLLDKGADMHWRSEDRESCTAYEVAASRGSVDILAAFVSHGLDINQTDPDGYSLLMMAPNPGQQELLEYLLTLGADVTFQEFDSLLTALHSAVQSSNQEAALILLRAAVKQDKKSQLLEARNSAGQTASFLAAALGKIEMLRMLHEWGADLCVTCSDSNWTHLHAAATWGHVDCVMFLIAAGLDINARARNGETALYQAAKYGRLSVVRKLLSKCADAAGTTTDGMTAFSIVG